MSSSDSTQAEATQATALQPNSPPPTATPAGVVPSDAPRVKVRIETHSPLTEVRVSDAYFRTVTLSSNVGPIETTLAEGVYEFSFRDGKSWQNKLLLLRANPGVAEPFSVHQDPLDITRALGPLEPEDIAPPAPAASPATSLVTLRALNSAGTNQAALMPPGLLEGVSVVAIDDEQPVTPRPPTQPTLTRRDFDLAPGSWRIRLQGEDPDRSHEVPLIICPGWYTVVELALDYTPNTPSTLRWNAAQSQIYLRASPHVPRDATLHSYARSALQSLAAGRQLQGAALDTLLTDLLGDKAEDPMLGIYAAHLLPSSTPDEQSTLESVVDNLARLVRAPPQIQTPQMDFQHPDVLALRLRLLMARGASLGDIPPFACPPMLAAGWRILMQAGQQRPDLIPQGSLTAEIAARLLYAEPWIAWTKLQRGTKPQPASRKRTTRGAGATSGVALLLRSLRPRAVPGSSSTTRSWDHLDDFLTDCREIRGAFGYRALREWYRSASLATPDASSTSGSEPPITSEERILAGILRPIATDEKWQPIFDASLVRSGHNGLTPQKPEDLIEPTGLPSTTLLAAASSLAEKFLAQARACKIDLQARSTTMALPDLLVPYDPAFLGDGFLVPPPTLGTSVRSQSYADGALVDYTHFSLVMHAARGVALFGACNIDAAQKVTVASSLEWQMDERVGECQLGPESYTATSPDRLQLVRRESILWGSVTEARLANKASCFYANAAPRHPMFDQHPWAALEEWVLERAPEFCYRLCVFTGPVLRDDDPPVMQLLPYLQAAFDVTPNTQIPNAFWKVIVARDAFAAGEDLSAVAFVMRQLDRWKGPQPDLLQPLKVHQVTLQMVEGWTGLSFGDLKTVDELAASHGPKDQPEANAADLYPQILSSADIVFCGPNRRKNGNRASRNASEPTVGPTTRLGKAPAKGECECVYNGFDARVAIEALNRDIVRLTGIIATQAHTHDTAPAGSLQAASATMPAAGAATRSVPEVPTQPGGPEAKDPRIEELVSAAPINLQPEMRQFALAIAEQADINRGIRQPVAPQQLRRIIGGEDVPPGEFLSCVCIGDATRWFCSGVLVAPRVVLTAAHCGHSITRVMIGGNKVPLLEPSALVVSVQKAEVHPDYRPQTNENDISVLILSQAALTPPVCIATFEALTAATEVHLVGFGYNDPTRPLGFGTKRQVRAPLSPIVKLAENQGLSAFESQLGFHAAYEFVAGRKGLGVDTCNGDSGGPAYLQMASGFIVAGVTSRATRGATLPCGDGGIYVRLAMFLPWINSVIGKAGLPLLE